uniref:Uncharacterized protein n=1 Tax=Solanum tuberosum TaxID=4113 RepID=M1D708_SOLTU
MACVIRLIIIGKEIRSDYFGSKLKQTFNGIISLIFPLVIFTCPCLTWKIR